MKINANGINLRMTLLSGQCFRMNEELDGSFTIVLQDRVINVRKIRDSLIIKSNKIENLKQVVEDYFDLSRNYDEINNMLLTNNPDLNKIIDYNKGYKILNQAHFEMLISYIISQNNSVKNISSSIEKICNTYGEKVIFEGKDYHLFPVPKSLYNVLESDYRKCGVGFRDKYIVNAINALKCEKNYLDNLGKLNTENALDKLMQIKGIGMKVASCILMFAYNRFDAFPIDTWVKKHFNTNIFGKIKSESKKKYGDHSGLVIQYMFNYQRNKNQL